MARSVDFCYIVEPLKLPNALTARTLRKADRSEDLAPAADAADLFNRLGI